MTDDGFTPDEARMLDGLLDVVVPPSEDGRLPGAGSLGLAPRIAREVGKGPMLRPVVEYGLSALAGLAEGRAPGGWEALTREERTKVVEEFAAGDQLFMPALLFLAYAAYYEHPRVLGALGFEARPPHPGGYQMEPDDLSLLEKVRARGRMWRE